MSWATTVVRLERNVGDSGWLHEDVKNFPAEFLVFCPHVGSLKLEDEALGLIREIAIERGAEEYRLLEGDKATTWKVFSVIHQPSKEARRDTGKFADRESLPILWALPTTGGTGLGKFWAFFPLVDQTTLSGIVNAPWKTNDDRTSLIDGDFNRELVSVVAGLVVRNLDKVRKREDPAWHLDVMPARGREARGWADEPLTSLCYKQAASVPCIPDQSGQLRSPRELKLHPREISQDVLQGWADEATRPEEWCHWTVETKDRRPRTERILELAGKDVSSLSEWIEALSDGRTPSKFAASIRVAAQLLRSAPQFAEEIARSWLLMDANGNVVQAFPKSVFLPSVEGTPASDRIKLLHPDLSEDVSLHPPFSTRWESFGLHRISNWRPCLTQASGAGANESGMCSGVWYGVPTLTRQSQFF